MKELILGIITLACLLSVVHVGVYAHESEKLILPGLYFFASSYWCLFLLLLLDMLSKKSKLSGEVRKKR